nr:MAG TPA: hypothetical protein [Bacteriophage sp.]
MTILLLEVLGIYLNLRDLNKLKYNRYLIY